MKLSIFLAGVRPQNWLPLYRSISKATTLPRTEFELVIVSPYKMPAPLRRKGNVRVIEDFGCPTRCYQLGLLNSQGEYVVWAADDGVFSPTLAIDKAFEILPANKGVVMLRYIEGGKREMSNLAWWRMKYHRMLAQAPYVPNDYIVIMLALMRRDHLMNLGGWDCTLEHVGLSCVDLSIRLQNDGAEVVIGENLMDTSLDKKEAGHAPVKQAHKADKSLFNRMYHHEHAASRGVIDPDNWHNAQAKWHRRFGR